MNEVSIIINGVRYDAVIIKNQTSFVCDECDLTHLCDKVDMGHITCFATIGDYSCFKKSNKKFER